jgi:hypothetical protein
MTLNPGEGRPRVPDITLERHRLGELSAAEAALLQRELEEDEELRARLAALERSDLELRTRHAPERLAEAVALRLRTPRPAARPMAPWLGRPVLAALAAAVVVWLGWPGPAGPPAVEPEVRLKGLASGLTLYRKVGEASEALAEGALVRPGDLIRVGYRTAGRAYGVILSIDGRGAVTLHLPRHGTRAARLQGGGTVLLDHAYQLDDAPRWERFYFVTGASAFEVGPVVQAARRLAADEGTAAGPGGLPLPPELDQVVFSLQKGAGR